MTKMFQSIYDNYSDYKSIVGSVLGYNTAFVEDIISDCCLNIHTRIKDGRIDIDNITINGKINKVYFKSVLIRKAIDHKRLKKNDRTNHCEIQEARVVSSCGDEYEKLINDSTECIMEKLAIFEKQSSSEKFRVDIYNFYYDKQIKISPLSKATEIPRQTLSESKKIIEKIIEENIESWLKEKEKLIF